MNKTPGVDIYTPIEAAVMLHPLAKLVPTERQVAMAEALEQFCLDAINKYYEGQQEHGGELCDRDLVAEVAKEQIDLFWYHKAQQWKER